MRILSQLLFQKVSQRENHKTAIADWYKLIQEPLNARNFSQCDSLLIGNECGAHTFPYIETKNKSSKIEHEATTSKIGEDQIFYCNQRGIDTEKAIALIVNGFSKEVLNKLPMEFAVEGKNFWK